MMAYTNNPRKVYGKVEIIYFDTDISSVHDVITSSNATISYPHEVYLSNFIPTVKACTMDGNSTMNGTFQMMDENCIVGWWGNELSDASGYFSSPQTIELFFLPRPIQSWMVIGDSKLNQYPVDFEMEYFSDGQIVSTQSYSSNNLVQKRIITDQIDITSIKIKITRWNNSNACVKILKFFDLLSETYEGKDIREFEVNEEMCSEDTNYNINSDVMSVTIYNKDQKFNVGYLKKLLVLDRKVKPYIGVEENETIQYTSLGIFYSEEWKIDDDGQWIKCVAVDKLLRLQNKTYVGFPLNYHVSIYDIAVDILAKSGFTSSQYVISSDLMTINVPMAFIPKQSVWDALQEIANAGLCKVFVDRQDRINIRSEIDPSPNSGVEINKTNMFSYSSNISLTEFANRISVEYCDVELSDDLVDAATTNIEVNSGESLELTIDYIMDISDASIESNNPNLTFSNFSSGVNACSVVIHNASPTDQIGTIKVRGFAIDVTYKSIAVQDEASIRDYGAFEYKHPASELIQSSLRATSIANILLEKLRTGEGVITTKWRGSPTLDLGRTYQTISKYDQEDTLICEYNKITFDGGLTQETRGRKITGGN